MIVEKLWPAIQESRLVLIPFQKKFRPPAKAIALPEILGPPADQKIRPLPRRMKYPCQHRRRGGLAMRAADHDGMVSWQKDFFQNFRQRAVRNLFIEYFLQLRIPPRDDISHHHQVRRRLQVRRIEGVVKRDSQA